VERRIVAHRYAESLMVRAVHTMLLPASASRIWDDLCSLWRLLMTAISGHYRPELHYMRGPGPKWREKQSRSEDNDGGTAAGDAGDRMARRQIPR
jgi:hypothetical protein